MAHFVADIHSFKMSHETGLANGVQERYGSLKSQNVEFCHQNHAYIKIIIINYGNYVDYAGFSDSTMSP